MPATEVVPCGLFGFARGYRIASGSVCLYQNHASQPSLVSQMARAFSHWDKTQCFSNVLAVGQDANCDCTVRQARTEMKALQGLEQGGARDGGR